ncbi:unnamed protein product [Linum tenue]|uniref:GDSL esterase/lipase n=1 Tax=Linum tenue TaxID=586396 RepID=A0AAV0PCS0_9ROSI|nr:unnamed protein product [Linum tenue]
MVGLVVGLAILLGCSLVDRVGAPDPGYVPPLLLVFGGSRGDSGNNNYLDTTVKADSPPYGIDSPTGQPTGRFSNYRNLPDFLSTYLDSEPPSPYLSPQLNGERLLYGANFASGGAGILNDTGLATRGSTAGGECDPELVNAASLFNSELNRLVQQLNGRLGLVFVAAANSVTLYTAFRSNPEAYGFTETRVACCGQGPYNGLGQCTPASNLCPNRDEYVFWDPTNPTTGLWGSLPKPS